MIALEQFLAHEPLTYRGYDGKRYTAQWLERPAFPLPFVDIRDENGTLQKRPYMSRAEATRFYDDIASDPTAHV